MEEERGSSSSFFSTISREQASLLYGICSQQRALLVEERERRRREFFSDQLEVGYFPAEWSLKKKRATLELFLNAIQTEEGVRGYKSIWIDKNSDDSRMAIITFHSPREASLAKKRLANRYSKRLERIEFVPRTIDQEEENRRLNELPLMERFFRTLTYSQTFALEQDVKYELEFGSLRPKKLCVGPIPEEHQESTHTAREYVINSLARLSSAASSSDRHISKHVYVAPDNKEEAQVEFFTQADCARAQKELLEHDIFSYANLLGH